MLTTLVVLIHTNSEKQNEKQVKSRIKNAALALFFTLLLVAGARLELTAFGL